MNHRLPVLFARCLEYLERFNFSTTGIVMSNTRFFMLAMWMMWMANTARSDNGPYIDPDDAVQQASDDPFEHCFGRHPCPGNVSSSSGPGGSGFGVGEGSGAGGFGVGEGAGAGGKKSGGGGAAPPPNLAGANRSCVTCGGGNQAGGGENRSDPSPPSINPPTCDVCEDFITPTGSYIDDSFHSYIHWGVDVPRIATSTLELKRFHRSREFFVAGGLGQGVVTNFDLRLRMDTNAFNSVYTYDSHALGGSDLNGHTWAFLTVPSTSARFNFQWDDDNILLPDERQHVDRVEILDDQMDPADGIEGVDTSLNFPGAKYAKVYNFDDSWFLFELILAEADSSWNVLNNHPPDGRLIEARNVDGTGYTITYKTWTQTEIDASPSRQWQIDTVTDALGNTLTFTYKTQQEAGNWVISKVTLPGSGGDIEYSYGGGFLSEVEYPDQTTSTFSYAAGQNGLIEMSIDDLAAPPMHRHKKVNLVGSVATVNGTVVPTTVGVARVVRNGENEVSYFSFIEDDSETWDVYAAVYEGAGMVRPELHLLTQSGTTYTIPKRYYKDGWTISYDQQEENYDITGTVESSYVRYEGNMTELLHGRPDSVIDERDIQRTHSYDTLGNRTMTVYEDDTLEAYCYNSRNQVTRYRDRNGNVTLFSYDSKGRRTKVEVGLTDSTSNTPTIDPYGSVTYDRCASDDVQTADYAKMEWQYHASGNGTDKLSKVIDWLGNETDYAYNGDDLLSKITGPADTSGGTRPETEFTYDSLGRLDTVTDPADHVTEYFYDGRHRLISTLYDDGSTFKRVYGTTGNSTGLLVKTIDRMGVVTTYEYDDADRLTKRVTAAAQMDGTTETATPELALTETWEYLDGTNKPTESVRAGAKTTYVYDYRGRRVETTVHTSSGESLTSELTYVDNKLFSSEDAHGRNTYFAYDATDGRLIRSVTGTTTEFSLADFDAVINKTRDFTANADYLIADTVFDAVGNIERIHDGRNMAIKHEYDSRNRLTARIADADYTNRSTLSNLSTALALRTETNYDDGSNVTERRSPRYFDSGDSGGYQKARQQWTYTDRGLVKTHVEAPGTTEAATESFVYDLLGRRTQHTDFAGKVWKTHHEDCCGQVTATENPLGHGSISRMDAGGRTVHQATIETYSAHTAALDNPVDAKTYREVTTRYDGRGRPVARTTWLTARGVVDADDPPIAGLDSVSASLGLTEQYLYDDNLADGSGLDATSGGLTANQLGGGTYSVNLSDALTKLADTEANGGAGISFSTTAPGTARVVINAEEELRFTIADATGRTVMTGIIEPHDGTNPNDLITWQCSSHDATTNLTGYGTVLVTKTINALGKVRQQHTDAAGRTIQRVDALGKITSFEYNAAGNQTKIRDPNNIGEDCTYDALGRDLTCTDTASDATSSSYDAAGNKITSTDAKSETTTYAFDARGRQVKATDRLAGETEFAYTATGQLSSLTDAEDDVTSYSYDDAGGKATETYPDHTGGTPGQSTYGIVTFTRDPAGRTLRKQDQAGDTVTYNYDLAGRLTSRDYRTSANSPSGTIADTDSFTYDDAGRMLTAVSGRYSNTVTYTYDDAGRKASEALTIASVTYTIDTAYDDAGQVSSYTYPDGTDVDRSYTDRGQLATVKVDSTTVDTRSYDNGGRMTSSVYNNGITATHAYNNDNTLASITHTGGSIGNYSYAWDYNKNKTSETITGTMSGYGFTVGSSGYDDEDRLVNWERDDTNLDQSWSLSLVGDWNSITENLSTQSRTHGAAHELLTAASASITHDVKGNMTSIPAVLRSGSNPLALSWDFDNRLTGADVDNDSIDDVTYGYDALGRRVKRDDGTNVTVFVQNGQQTFLDYPSGTAATSPTYCYIYASYVDEPIMRIGHTGGGEHYYHRNQQYSIVAFSDQNGNIKERYSYTAYGGLGIYDPGGVARSSSNYDNRYTYTGREWDEELELYHFRARTYDPLTGRFCSRDPIGFEGSPWNLYEYAFTNPTRLNDPYGECAIQPPSSPAPLTPAQCCRNAKGKSTSPGATICCAGNIITCVWPDKPVVYPEGPPLAGPQPVPITLPPGKARDMWKQCIQAHETEHKDRHSVDCVGRKDGDPPRAKPDVGDKNDRECLAGKKDIACLKRQIQRCKRMDRASPGTCDFAALEEILSRRRTIVNKACSDAGRPLPR